MPAKKPGGYAAALKFRSKLLVLPQLDANNIEEWDLVANNGFYSAGWLKMWEASNTEGAKDADATAQKTGKVRGVSSRSLSACPDSNASLQSRWEKSSSCSELSVNSSTERPPAPRTI